MDRILTTHVGSLIRPRPLLDFLAARREASRTIRRLRARAGRRRRRRRAAPGRGRNRRHRRRRDGQVSWITYLYERVSGHRAAHGAARRRLASCRRAATARRSPSSTPSTTPRSPARSRTRCRSRTSTDDRVAAEIEPRGSLVLHRPDPLRPDRARARHRQPEERARGRRGRRRVPPGGRAGERLLAATTSTTRARRSSSSRVADALHEEYRRIVDAGFLLQVDDAVLLHEYDSIALARRLDRRLPALGGAARSRRSTTRSRASRRSASATTSAAAAGTARTPSTRRSPTSSTSCSRCNARYYLIEQAQPAPRARVAHLGGRRAARGQGARPGRRHAPHERRRASGARRRAARPARGARRPRERDGRAPTAASPRGLPAARAPDDPVGEARGARRGRADRDEAALGAGAVA